MTPFFTYFSQVPFPEAIKKAPPDVIMSTVGMITTPQQAYELLAEGKEDGLAREFLQDARALSCVPRMTSESAWL